MCKESCSELLSKLNDDKRDENQRYEDLNSAFKWLHAELENMKEQDKTLMKTFTQIRETLNDINENGLLVDRGRSFSDVDYIMEVQRPNIAYRCKLDPFDVEPDDGTSLRRRAFTFGSSGSTKTINANIAIENCIKTANNMTQAF